MVMRKDITRETHNDKEGQHRSSLSTDGQRRAHGGDFAARAAVEALWALQAVSRIRAVVALFTNGGDHSAVGAVVGWGQVWGCVDEGGPAEKERQREIQLTKVAWFLDIGVRAKVARWAQLGVPCALGAVIAVTMTNH